jgi:hypothetical protein
VRLAPFSTYAQQRWLWAIIGVAVCLRVGAAVYLGNSVVDMPGIADQLSYHTLAIRVLEGHGFSFGTGWWPATPADQPTAHWSYLYVLFLAAIYGVVGPVPLAARVIQALLVGVLQPLLTYRIAHRLFGPRVGLVSAAIAGGYAYFVYYAGALMTESLCIVALLWSVHVALRIGAAEEGPPGPGIWLQLGLALLTAVLLRQAVLLRRPRHPRLGGLANHAHERYPAAGARAAMRPLAGVTLAIVVLAAGILPWTIRNQRAFDQFVLLNTNAGFAFYWGNHPIHGTEFVPILPAGEYGRLIPDDLRGLNEAELDKALLARGFGLRRLRPRPVHPPVDQPREGIPAVLALEGIRAAQQYGETVVVRYLSAIPHRRNCPRTRGDGDTTSRIGGCGRQGGGRVAASRICGRVFPDAHPDLDAREVPASS